MEKINDGDEKAERLQQAHDEIDFHEKQKSQIQSTFSTNDDKIRRLDVVKKNLELQKSNAKNNHINLKSYSENKSDMGDWSGAMNKRTIDIFENDIVSQYGKYVDRIDDVLDFVCDEITRLQNENMQLEWDIFHIGSLINSLLNEIEKLCN